MYDPFRYIDSSPVVIRLSGMLSLRYPLSLRQVEDPPYERGIDICHGVERGAAYRPLVVEPAPLFAVETGRRRAAN